MSSWPVKLLFNNKKNRDLLVLVSNKIGLVFVENGGGS